MQILDRRSVSIASTSSSATAVSRFDSLFRSTSQRPASLASFISKACSSSSGELRRYQSSNRNSIRTHLPQMLTGELQPPSDQFNSKNRQESAWSPPTLGRRLALSSKALAASMESNQMQKIHQKRNLSLDTAPIVPAGLTYQPLPSTDTDSTLQEDSSRRDLDKKDPSGGRDWKILVALCTFSVALCYADRSNISTAMIEMASDFGWDKSFQGWVLSSFFFGYAFTQVLGGQLADRYGGKFVLAAGVASWSLFTALTPEAAAAGVVPLIATRILLGVGEGVAFPSIHSLISQNVPYSYQSTAVGIATAASYAGTALAFGASPYISGQVGWPGVFHNFAAVAVVWLPLWLIFAKTRPPPSSHSSSSSLDSVARKPIFDKGLLPLLQRREVLAICVAQYCGSWGLYGLLSWLPTFFSDYYKIELQDLASFTLLPYVVQGGVGALTGVLAGGWSEVSNLHVHMTSRLFHLRHFLIVVCEPY